MSTIYVVASLATTVAIATLVPLLVAPFTTFFTMRRLFDVEDARARVREVAIRDGLTRLYNRRFFMARLQAEVQRAERSATRYSRPSARC